MWMVAASFRRTHNPIVDWLGLTVGGHRRSVYSHQVNRVNSHNDSTIIIVVVIIIIIIIF